MDDDERPAREMTPERVLALAGTAGLLLVFVVILVMVAGTVAGGDEDELTPLAAATPTPTRTPAPSPTPVPLTAGQKAARRAARDVVRDQGYEPLSLKSYKLDATLRVLVGHPSGDEDGARRAFFFVEETYVGNDVSDPSAKLFVKRAGDKQVTLAYRTWAPDDESCCPTGGPVDVRFKWDGAQLIPLDPIPPSEQRAPRQ